MIQAAVTAYFIVNLLTNQVTCVDVNASSSGVAHNNTGTIHCTVSDTTFTTNWKLPDGTIATQDCTSVIPSYIKRSSSCNPGAGIFVFDVDFDRTRDCGDWRCEYFDGSNDLESIRPFEYNISHIPEIIVSNTSNVYNVTCSPKRYECAFPAPVIKMFNGNYEVAPNSTTSQDCESSGGGDCALMSVTVTNIFYLTANINVSCIIDDTYTNSHELVYYKDTGNTPPSSDTHPGAIVGGILVTILIISLLVAVVYYKKKKKREELASAVHSAISSTRSSNASEMNTKDKSKNQKHVFQNDAYEDITKRDALLGPPRDLVTSRIRATSTTLLWKRPKSIQSTQIVAYHVEMKGPFSDHWTRTENQPGKAPNLIISDLAEGKKYSFRVAAQDRTDVGPFCQSVDVIPQDDAKTKKN